MFSNNFFAQTYGSPTLPQGYDFPPPPPPPPQNSNIRLNPERLALLSDRTLSQPISDQQRVCAICKRAFSTKHHFEEHMRRHTGEKPYKCERCPKTFSQRSGLNQHRKKHEGDTNTWQCTFKGCSRRCISRSILTIHLRSHTGEKPFKCGIGTCRKQFSTKSNLTVHIRTHSGFRPFACKHCNKKFSMQGNLITHVRTHTGERPFECQTCNKKFTTKGNLTAHLRIHNGVRTFSCSTCSKAFTMDETLRTHERMHCMDKYHTCSSCGKPHSSLMSMNAHIQIYHAPTDSLFPFQCRNCKKRFVCHEYLVEHSQRYIKGLLTTNGKARTISTQTAPFDDEYSDNLTFSSLQEVIDMPNDVKVGRTKDGVTVFFQKGAPTVPPPPPLPPSSPRPLNISQKLVFDDVSSEHISETDLFPLRTSKTFGSESSGAFFNDLPSLGPQIMIS